MGEGWRRWLVRDGRLRALWRVLLYLALVAAIAFWGVVVLAVVGLPASDERLGLGLILQDLVFLAAALIAAWMLLRAVDHRPTRGLGFPFERRAAHEVAMGLLAGGAGLGLAVAVVVALGGYRYVAQAGSVAGWAGVSVLSLGALVIPAAAEEVLFRGYLLRTITEGAGPVAGIGVTSALFAWVHGSNPEVTAFALLNIFLAGVLLAVAVARTGGRLWLATAVHLGWNWAMAGPLDLPVSGLDAYDVPLYDVSGTGPAWLTGGPFGPEGGLVGTGAALIALVLVLRITRPGARLAGHSWMSGRHDDVEDR